MKFIHISSACLNFLSKYRLSICGSTVLCLASVAFQFLNFTHCPDETLDGGSARRKTATYTQNNTNTE
jgi:hypothetical protein